MTILMVFSTRFSHFEGDTIMFYQPDEIVSKVTRCLKDYSGFCDSLYVSNTSQKFHNNQSYEFQPRCEIEK